MMLRRIIRRIGACAQSLGELIAHRRQKRLLDLMGKLEWDVSFDYKAERTRD